MKSTVPLDAASQSCQELYNFSIKDYNTFVCLVKIANQSNFLANVNVSDPFIYVIAENTEIDGENISLGTANCTSAVVIWQVIKHGKALRYSS